MRVSNLPIFSRRVALAASITLAAAGSVSTVQAARPSRDQAPQLSLVTEKYLPGSFLGHQSVYADANFIYAAANTGEVFVMQRDRKRNFPLVDTIDVSIFPLTGIRGVSPFVYVTAADGTLTTLQVTGSGKAASVVIVAQTTVSASGANGGLNAVQTAGSSLYVGCGQGEMAVSPGRVFLSELNEGDVALEMGSQGNAVQTFGQVYEGFNVVAFERGSGQRLHAIATPTNIYGGNSQVAIFTDGNEMILTTPGCCGAGISIYSADTLAFQDYIPEAYTNTVVKRGPQMVGGKETGEVVLFDRAQFPAQKVATVNLRVETGHTGAEDIEIRAVWTDGNDNLIFAGSSWGNDASRGPQLPSFFIVAVQ